MTRINRREALSVGAAGVLSLTVADASVSEETKPMTKQKEPRVTPFLAFFGDAEKAMKRYVGLIENSKIVSVEHFGPGEVGKEGTVKVAEFTLNGQRVLCNDIPGEHNWTFTPAVSLYVENSNEEALAKYFEVLSKDGKILMPLDEYPFSEKFAWVEDEFGVSWQLNIAK
ncbi:MAG: VOC family protein [Bythopirellula sp.]